MDDLTAARLQMEVSLAFHMVFAAAGVALPVMMLLAEGLWIRHGRQEALALARTWAKATGLLFAIGAVSGTALSFELGLLWPRFLAFAGPLIGPAFAFEGYAFFLEAIFLGLYLYGWQRLSPHAHWLCGLMVALSGAASAVLVVSANAWMQQPVGFRLADGQPQDIDPVAALFNPSWPLMALHSTMACYTAVGFAAAGLYAWALLHDRRPERVGYNRLALAIALAVGLVGAITMPLSGDLLARRAAHVQPAKLAALEGQFRTERGAPLRIGGWPDPTLGETRYAIEIPRLLSLLATEDPDGLVLGLDAFPRDEWPEARIVHPAFQVMVGAGVLLLALGLWGAIAWWRGRRDGRWPRRPLLWGLVAGAPLGFVALEAGWIVTEVGRQPWVIYGVMRTRDAVTTVGGVGWTLAGFTLLYLLLGATLVILLRRLAAGEPAVPAPVAPPPAPHPTPQLPGA
jgi:cytochrome d ubiquinol oxidase subunit I